MLFLRIACLIVAVSLCGPAIAAEAPIQLLHTLKVTDKGAFLDGQKITCAKLAGLTQQHLSADHGTYFDEHCIKHEQNVVQDHAAR
jgi:hypothetical protein